MNGEALVKSDNYKPSNTPQGVKYVGGDTDYISTDIDAESIVRLSVQNFLFARTKSQQMNLIFPNPYTLTVYDANNDIDEDVSQDMRNMCSAKDVNLWMKMQLCYSDVFEGGAMISNPVWKYDGGVYTLTELNHLPWESFDCSPGEAFKVQSEILQGIGINANGEIKFYQNNIDGQPVELTNVIMIKNPMAKGVAGTPLCLPIIPLISGSTFSLNAQTQKVNRVGAPTPFLKITEPQPASAKNGMVSDEEYAQMFLKNYSKDILMPLRGNMELVDSHMEDNGSALETIEYFNKQIIGYFSPSSMIQSDGNSIGGNDASELGLLMRYVSSVHEWIENPFEELLQIYLDVNGYEGFSVEIEIPEPEIDNTEQDLKKADAMTKRPTEFYKNEYRSLLGQDELEEFEGQFMEAASSPFTSFENSQARPTPKEAEKESEEEQKDIWEEAFKKAAKLLEGAIE